MPRIRERQRVPGPPLGIFADADYEAATVTSVAGAITFLSDGVVEAKNGTGELLGSERLAALCMKSPARSRQKPSNGARRMTLRSCRWPMRSLVLLLFFCASSFAQLYEAKSYVYRDCDDLQWSRPGPLGTAATSPWLLERCRIDIPRLAAPGALCLQIDIPSAGTVNIDGRQAGFFPAAGGFTPDVKREVPLSERTHSRGDRNNER